MRLGCGCWTAGATATVPGGHWLLSSALGWRDAGMSQICSQLTRVVCCSSPRVGAVYCNINLHCQLNATLAAVCCGCRTTWQHLAQRPHATAWVNMLQRQPVRYLDKLVTRSSEEHPSQGWGAAKGESSHHGWPTGWLLRRGEPAAGSTHQAGRANVPAG